MMLRKSLQFLEFFFELDLLAHKDFQITDTNNYYHINKWAYSLFHTKKYTHMGISDSKKLTKKDYEKAPDLVANSISSNHKNILEIACGRGGSLSYLAEKFPNKKFYGLDYSQTQLSFCPELQNVSCIQGDFHSLPYDDDSMDVVFVIEALCHSSTKEVVFQEVNRILKTDGKFVVIDGYAQKIVAEMSTDELLGVNVVTKGMAVQMFETYEEVKKKAQQNGLTAIYEKDYTQQILPNTDKFKRLAKLVLSGGLFSRFLIKRIFPSLLSINIVAGYLLSDLIRTGTVSYWMTVYEK